MPSQQGIYWMLTIPHYGFTPYLPPNVAYIRGQLEIGQGGFLHWQLMVTYSEKKSLHAVREMFGTNAHCELTRSKSASAYVWKDETRVEGTKFELGRLPTKRNSQTDWDDVWKKAQEGDLLAIAPDIRVRSYFTLRAIAADFARPVPIIRSCRVYIGATGTGKSRRAWDEAGMEAFPKNPTTKFWCGYHGQENVVIDEFRGDISISHLLRWLDRYPVLVEIKGSSTVLRAKTIWITSNKPVEEWYPMIDPLTLDALLRRLEITIFQ